MLEPLTPPDCDLRGLDYMPLLGNHLFGSEFNARANDSEWRAALTLWWAAWTQKPAASLPNDDAALCRLADLGRDLRAWKKVKAMALYGFVECSDGRLYHKTLAEQAMIAWGKRVKERERKAEWREKRDQEKQGHNENVPRDGTGTDNGTNTGQGRGQDADVPADGNRRDGTGRDNIIPFSNENGADDPEKAFWDRAKAYLGKSKSSHIGKWVSKYGREETAKAITAAQVSRAIDPPAYIERCLKQHDGDHVVIGI